MFHIEYGVLIIDVKTRWNSTYHMIVRAKDLKLAVQALCVHEKSLTSLQLTEEEWSYLTVVEQLLVKFDRATKLMSMERHPTIHSYIPTFDWIVECLNEFAGRHNGVLRNAALGALTKMKKYEPTVDKCIIPFVATVLHPALKLTYFKEHGYSAAKIRDIKKAVAEYFTREYEAIEDGDVQEDQVSSDDELRSHMFKRSRIEKTSSEFVKYVSLPLANRKIDPIVYWKSQASEFPRLTMMARDIFAVQSASTGVERDFSKGSRFVTPNRCSMLQTTIKASMVLKSWYDMA